MLLFGSIYIQIYITESNCLPMMFNCASLIGKMWQFFFPEPEVFLSISRCTQSLVFSRWIPLPCIEVSAIEQRSKSISNQRILGGPFCLQLLWAEFWATFPANAPEKTIHCDANYGDVTMEKKKQMNALEWPALRVHPDVEPALLVLFKGHHLFSFDVVKGELLAAGVRSGRSVGQLLAVDGLILYLSVCRLVDQLWSIRAVYNLQSQRKQQFKHKNVERASW